MKQNFYRLPPDVSQMFHHPHMQETCCTVSKEHCLQQLCQRMTLLFLSIFMLLLVFLSTAFLCSLLVYECVCVTASKCEVHAACGRWSCPTPCSQAASREISLFYWMTQDTSKKKRDKTGNFNLTIINAQSRIESVGSYAVLHRW